MSNDGSSSRSNVSNLEIPTTNTEEELNSSASIDRDANSLKLSAASSITKKRLMRSKSDVRSSKDSTGCPSEVIEAVNSLINHSLSNAVHRFSSARCTYTHIVYRELHWPGLLAGEDQTTNRLVHVATSAASGTEYETISNSMNTSETMTTEGIFMNVLTRTATVTRSVLEFTGALSTLLGTQTERFSDEDPRIIPFVYIQSGDRQQFYIEGPVNSDSGFTRSSAIGTRSEISSISESEPPSTQTRSRRVGQDAIPLQLFDMSWIMTARKPLFELDDEPSIYN
ncbi:uncharacterized protein LOC143217361 [Lasioglossum baleicum]|uniref:uncharacterized protein LOC143217361 n=1 Tax=Lasioglossum baleicum TaxID=434251 RepID=UPI003FCEDFA5